MPTKKQTKDIMGEVTDRVLEALEAGTVPWHKPWQAAGVPVSATTGKAYRGINPFILNMVASTEGFTSNEWITFKAAAKASFALWRKENDKPDTKEAWEEYRACEGAYRGVEKGAKGVALIYWHRFTYTPKDGNGDPVTDDTGQPVKRPGYSPRPFTVFNLEQTGLPMEEAEAREIVPCEEADRIIAATGANYNHDGGARAYYRPATDSVHMPAQEAFDSDGHYYRTAFHELTHWTGHPSRLNREGMMSPEFGNDPYAREELVAEIGASIVTGYIGGLDCPDTLSNEAAYIASWIKRLKDDRTLIVSAAAKAQKAADLILGIEWEGDDN
jgi:antirestriction protein ArdC